MCHRRSETDDTESRTFKVLYPVECEKRPDERRDTRSTSALM